jgi:hypothetical protein
VVPTKAVTFAVNQKRLKNPNTTSQKILVLLLILSIFDDLPPQNPKIYLLKLLINT